MKEYFDVVDKSDNPTGTLTNKTDAHEKGLLHRCVAVYVFDADGRLYIQPHLKSKGLLDHSVGGHVASGESYRIAAKREGEEELGLYGQRLELLAMGVYSDENFNGALEEFNVQPFHMYGVFECHPSATWQFIPNDEVASLYPEKLEVIIEQMNKTPGKFTPGFINTMSKYIEVKKLPITLDLKAARRNWSKTRD